MTLPFDSVLSPGKTRTQLEWQQHSILQCFPSVAKRGNIIVSGAATINVSEGLCAPQMLRAWQNESTFWKHDHVSCVLVLPAP